MITLNDYSFNVDFWFLVYIRIHYIYTNNVQVGSHLNLHYTKKFFNNIRQGSSVKSFTIQLQLNFGDLLIES